MKNTEQKPVEGDLTGQIAIPDKLFFKIREVAKITQVKAHILRYWENEFPQLKPRKSKSGQRIYSRKDIEKLLEIKKLLYVDRFSIEGARRHMVKRFSGRNEDEKIRKTVADIRNSLQEILDVLK